MKTIKFTLMISLIIVVVILVFYSVKINIDFFVCPDPTKFLNCEYENNVNILYLNPPYPSDNPNIDSIRGIEKGKQTKYNCDPATLDCLYDLQPNN